LPHEFEQRARLVSRMFERQCRVLADLQFAPQIFFAVAEGPDPPKLPARLRARDNEPPVANGQGTVGPALASFEVFDREVGQRTGVGPTKGLFITSETGRHTGRHSEVAVERQL
jgi:hypothetical protein